MFLKHDKDFVVTPDVIFRRYIPGVWAVQVCSEYFDDYNLLSLKAKLCVFRENKKVNATKCYNL